MEKALAVLCREEREVLYLNVVEGYSAQEIAILTDCSRNTILSLIYRGKQKFAQFLYKQVASSSSHHKQQGEG